MTLNAHDTIPEMLWRDMRWLEDHAQPRGAQRRPHRSDLAEADTVVAVLPLDDPFEPIASTPTPVEHSAPAADPVPARPDSSQAECQQTLGDHERHQVDDCEADSWCSTRRKLFLAGYAALGLSIVAIVGVFAMLGILEPGSMAAWQTWTFVLVGAEVCAVVFFLVFTAVGIGELIARRQPDAA